MRTINHAELEQVSGAGIVGDAWDDIKRIAKELPELYDSLVDSTSDMICSGTGNC